VLEPGGQVLAVSAILAAIMNVLLSPQPPFFPHHYDPARPLSTTSRKYIFGVTALPFYANNFCHGIVSPFSTTMGGRKRKADDEVDFTRTTAQDASSFEDNMSVSPTASPAIAPRTLARPSKKLRSNEIIGKPLSLPRLLETLDAESLRTVLQSICERHPEIGPEVVNTSPRPSVSSALEVLAQYQDKLHAAFPFGGNGGSDYAYNRVKSALTALIDALTDFTPHYLPPNESQVTTSLSFLDGATKVVHELPNWENSSHKYHKDNAYDEISRAWALVISEASKKGGGFLLHNGEWDQKLAKHNEQAGGKMQIAVNALGSNLGWIGGGPSMETGDSRSIRNQLFSGTYGSNLPVHVGPW
jgi:protein Cut8